MTVAISLDDLTTNSLYCSAVIVCASLLWYKKGTQHLKKREQLFVVGILLK